MIKTNVFDKNDIEISLNDKVKYTNNGFRLCSKTERFTQTETGTVIFKKGCFYIQGKLLIPLGFEGFQGDIVTLEILKFANKSITTDEVIQHVSKQFGINNLMQTLKCNESKYVLCRYLIMYIFYYSPNFNYSLAVAGAVLFKNHATVLHGNNRIRNIFYGFEPKYKKSVVEILNYYELLNDPEKFFY